MPSGFHIISDTLKVDVNVDKYFDKVAYSSLTSLINERQYFFIIIKNVLLGASAWLS